jgi:hypothetical protein
MASDEQIVAQIRTWRDELIDLSRRNKLLNLRVGAGALTIEAPHRDVVLDGLQRGWRFHYPPPDDEEQGDDLLMGALSVEDTELTDVLEPDELKTNAPTASRLSTTIRTLDRRSTSEWVDKGLRVLYLAVGQLAWTDADLDLRSPLLLIPASLARPNPREPFRLRATDEEWVVNPALTVKLEQDYGVNLPLLADDGLEAFFAEVRAAIRANASWRVHDSDLVLSAFSFAKEAMYQDLKENETLIAEHEIVRVLCGEQRDSLAFDTVALDQLDAAIARSAAPEILDADSTQRQCLLAGIDGRSFVMDGPPGTGKSQTIANLISQLMWSGRSVLFVSEKAAALEVVKSRLDGAGLGNYVLELHSNKATRKEVAVALGEALTSHPAPRVPSSELEIKQLEQRRGSLSKYAVAVNRRRDPLGRTLIQVLGRISELADLPDLASPPGFENLSAATLASIIDEGERLGRSWDPVVREDFLWADLADPVRSRGMVATYRRSLAEARDLLSSAAQRHAAIAARLLMSPPSSLADFAEIDAVVAQLEAKRPVPVTWLTTDDTSGIRDRIRTVENMVRSYNAALATLRDRAGERYGSVPSGRSGSFDELPTELASMHHEPASALTTHHQAGGGMVAFCDAVLGAVRTIAETLEVPMPSCDLDGASRLAALAQIPAEAVRPVVEWVGRLDEVSTEFTRAAQQVEQVRAAEVQLGALFDLNQLHRLDIEAFFDGPNDLVAKFGWFGSGRANKAQLAACAHSGKAGGEEKAAVPAVREWKRLLRAIESDAPRLASVIGRDWVGAATDLPALADRLGATRRLADLVGRDPLSDRYAALLEGAPSLAEPVAAWGVHLRGLLDSPPGDIRPNVDFAGLRGWYVGQVAMVEQALDWIAPFRPVVGDSVTLDAALAMSLARDRIDEWRSRLMAENESATLLFGDRFVGLATDWDGLRADLAWTDGLRALIGTPISGRQALLLLDCEESAAALESDVQLYRKLTEEVLEAFTAERAARISAELAGRVDVAHVLLEDLEHSVTEVEQWASFVDARSSLAALGLSEVVDFCVDRRVDAQQVCPMLERAALSGWADAVLASDHDLSPMGATDRDALVHQFRVLDRSTVAHAAASVIDRCNARRPKSLIGEPGIIKSEAVKKQRHLPIRRLLDKAGSAAKDLKPCFMMSPLSVSQFLPTSLTFDTVIFDEASQVRPSDAVNAIYRASQVIVAGDDKQLPPTSFFANTASATNGAVPDDDDVIDHESVLDLFRGNSRLGTLSLRWHYRSRHEGLITFSNHEFYNGGLITYPAATDLGADVGVEFFHVPDGIYGRGAARDNPIEAKRVVDRVLHHAAVHPHLTMGVVAFSEAQATRIQLELEAARRERPDLDAYFGEGRLDGFFVKNLENVQGDERDLIIFSVGYGPDQHGKVSLNFGPLNKDGGHRRLNVAITRARQRVELVSSIRAGDIAHAEKYGVQCLRRYLDYAERGLLALNPEASRYGGETESPFEDSVLERVRQWGYDAVPQVGHHGYRIDLAVRDPRNPGRYVIGIECDGAAYHSGLVARDRDRLRQEVLEGLGWTLHRIWGPAWYRLRSEEEARLRRAIEDAIEGRDSVTPPAPSTMPAVHEVADERVDIAFDEHPPWVESYRPVVVPSGSVGLADMADWSASADLRRWIKSIVQREAPITKNLLLRRLREVWGGASLTVRRVARIDDVIQQLVTLGDIREIDRDTFSIVGSETWVVRTPDDDPRTRRSAAEVPQVEIEAALVHLVRDARRVTPDELTSRAAALFGWQRRGADIQAALDRSLTRLLSTGRILETDDDRYVIGE